MVEVDVEQVQRLKAALSPSRDVAVQIGRVLASRLGLSLDERIELVDTVAPLVEEMLQQEQLSAALRELPPHELQLLPLLENAVARADDWHAAACGCSGGHDDRLMDQARATVAAWRRSCTETA
jgi:hypothetical protein